MKNIFILTIVISLSAVSLFSQTCEWAERIGGTSVTCVYSVTTDSSGNYYIAGYSCRKSNGTLDTLYFNNAKSLIIEGSRAGFIAKYNKSGLCQWAEQIAGDGIVSATEARKISVDEIGNIYVAGMFSNTTITFNNGKNLESTSDCIYVAKYDNTGLCQWVDKIEGNSALAISGIKHDAIGNVYLAGNFQGSIGFSNGTHLDGYKFCQNKFLAKFSNNGLFMWGEQIICYNEYSTLENRITIDENNNIYLTGDFRLDTLKLNNGKYLTLLGEHDSYIAKYNSNGLCQSVTQISGKKGYVITKSLALDSYNNLIIVGISISDTVIFGNGKKLKSEGNKFAFISKYDEKGTCLWAEKICFNSSNIDIYEVKVDDANNIYIIGNYSSDSLKFNNGKILFKEYNQGTGFIAKFNNSGICQWAEQISSYGEAIIFGLSLDKSNNLYIAGFFKASITLNNGKILKLGGYDDAFIARYTQNSTSVLYEPILDNISVYPNPASNYIEIKTSKGSDFQIFNMLGEIVLSVEQTPPYVQRIDISKLSHGIYFLKIGNRVEKFVKI